MDRGIAPNSGRRRTSRCTESSCCKSIGKKFGKNSACLQTIGYKEIINYLDKKNVVETQNFVPLLQKTIELIKIHTRQFAKRQMTWFNGMQRRNKNNKINWIRNFSEAKRMIKIFL